MLDRAGLDVRVVTEGGASRWPEPLARLQVSKGTLPSELTVMVLEPRS